MKEEIKNYYPIFKIFSINNNINPTVDILIESIDRFSFGEESDDEKSSNKENGEEKKRKDGPNNFGYIKTENNLIESNSKIKDLNSLINNIDEIKMLCLEEKKNKGKICGIFNKEDFEIKLDEKKNNHKNNQLNDSFEKKYNNPLKKFLDDDEEENNNNNNNNINNIILDNNKSNIKENLDINNRKIKDEKVEKDEIKISEDINKKENNLINSNSEIKKDNYESDDTKKSDKEKDIINDDAKEKEILKFSEDEENEEEEEKKENNNKINSNPINQIIENNNNDNDNEIESPRLGNGNEEKIEIKKQEEIKEVIKDNLKKIEPKKLLNEEFKSDKKEEKPVNAALNKNKENIIQKVNEEKINIQIPKKEEKNKNLAELKENSFIIKQSTKKEKKEKDNEETNKEILELKQKLEEKEKDAQKMKEEKEKLLEVINMFKNLQSIETKKTPNSGKNSRSDTPKRQIIKKRCDTPTLSRANIIYGNAPVVHHKRSNSYNKIRIIKNNENKLYIDYLPVKQKTYRQLHGKENNQKKGKKINQKINVNNNPKMYGNYINRNTIYLTGASSNKYAKSPYLNNNMNYTGISYNNNLNNKKFINSYNNYVYMNNSSQSFYINNSNIDDTYGNLYQRQVMQLPPNEQPLFYETRSNMNNNMYHEFVYNKNINYNSENNFNKYKIIENNNKYLQEMPSPFNNSNDLTLNNHMGNNINKAKRNKNKLLDFKDFQIIFDESNNTHNIKSNQTKNNENKNFINNNFSKNNNNIIENNNNNYNLINYREYSNYKLNEFNNNLNNENPNNFETKKNIEKLSKGIEDDNQKKKSKGKNDNSNNLNFGLINNFNKNKKKNYKNNNEKNNNQNKNLSSKEFGRNREKIEYNNCLNDSDDFNGIIKNKKNNKKKENSDKLGKDYMLPFYLINRNDMLNNILNYISNDKIKKRINNPINDKKKNN